MPIHSDYFEILRCPKTRQPLKGLSENQRAALNDRIAKGECTYADGEQVEEQLDEGIITQDGALVYRVDDGIPVMLPEKAIPLG